MIKQKVLGKTNRLTFLSLQFQHPTGQVGKNTLVSMGDEVNKN
jgi:hypothetical protein